MLETSRSKKLPPLGLRGVLFGSDKRGKSPRASLNNDEVSQLEIVRRSPTPRSRWSYLGGWGLWFNFLLLTIMVLTIIWSVTNAGWADRLPSLILVALLGLVLGLVFAHMSRVPAPILHLVSLYLGTFVTSWQTITVMPGSSLDAKIVDLVLRINAWGYAARTGGINNDALVFVFFVVAATWLISYLSAWFIFRHHQVWLGILPSGIAGLVNLSYAPNNLTSLYIVYLVLALVLIMRVKLSVDQRVWQLNQVQYPRALSRSFLRYTIGFATFIMLLTWLLPTTEPSTRVSDLWFRLVGPWQDTQMEFNRLFGSVSAKEGGLGDFARAMVLRGEVSSSTQVVMTVTAPEPHYWRGISYDRYTGEGWIKSDRPSQQFPVATERILSDSYLLRKEITETFHLNVPLKSLLFAAGQPIAATIPFQAEGQPEPPLSFNFVTGQNVDSLPPELQEFAAKLQTPRTDSGVPNRPGMRRGYIPEEAARDLPPEWRVVSYETRGNAVVGMVVEPVRPLLLDVAAAHNTIAPKQRQYTVLSSVSIATTKDLRQAGTAYPEWVRTGYLSLPDTLPGRVRRLARQITNDATNPYDKAVALETYLRGLTYTTKLPSPPVGRDVVDFFLFDTQRGYCDYFASALAVMLRSVGIPARVVSGYQPGDFDAGAGGFVVRGTNAHSWVEAFFPSYGWIEFEPSPSRPVIERPTDEESKNATSSVTDSSEDPSAEFPDATLTAPEEESDLGQSVGALIARRADLPAWPLMVLPLIFALVVVFWYVWHRELRGLAPAEFYYARMCRLAAIARKGPRAWQTPAEYAAALSLRVPSVAQPIQQIAQVYTRVRFGRKDLGSEEQTAIERDWGRLRRKLFVSLWRR